MNDALLDMTRHLNATFRELREAEAMNPQRLNITNNLPHPIKATVRPDGEVIDVTIGYDLAAQCMSDELRRAFGLPPTIYGKPVVVDQSVLDGPTWRFGPVCPSLWPHQEEAMRRMVQGDDPKSLEQRITALRDEIAAPEYVFAVWWSNGRRELFKRGNHDLTRPDAAYPPGAEMPARYVSLIVGEGKHGEPVTNAAAMIHFRAGLCRSLCEVRQNVWRLNYNDGTTREVKG